MDAPLADGEGAHADVLLKHVAVAEQHVLPVQLLQRAEEEEELSEAAEGRAALEPPAGRPQWGGVAPSGLTWTTGWGSGLTGSSEPSSSSSDDAMKLKPRKSW